MTLGHHDPDGINHDDDQATTPLDETSAYLIFMGTTVLVREPVILLSYPH